MNAKKEPPLQVITGKRSGPPRMPLEKRRSLDKDPHRGRKGPKDLPAGETLSLKSISAAPPIKLSKYERECWDMITANQRGMGNSAWLYKTDTEYLLATCVLYGRWRQIRDELDSYLKRNGGSFIDPESGNVHPLLAKESAILAKYHTSLGALGLVPTRRMVTLAEEQQEDEDGLLA